MALFSSSPFEGSGVFGVGASLILLWLCEGFSRHVLEQVQIDSVSMFLSCLAGLMCGVV